MAVYKKVPGHETVNISTLEFDETPTQGSLNPVTSDGVAKVSSNLEYLTELFFLNTKNMEIPRRYANVGDGVYVDGDGKVHILCGKSIVADSVPAGLTYKGSVALREGDKAVVLHNTENTSVKWASMWLFRVYGLKLDGTDTMVLQQGPSSGSTPVEIGTFTATAAATDLDTLVSELDTWLRANATAAGALSNYNWHAEKHADADGVDSCFIVVDNISYQSFYSPIKSSSSGASAKMYMWDWCGYNEDFVYIMRKDGVMTSACVWNKESFKLADTNVGSPTDSLTTRGLFDEAGFNGTTVVKAHYGTYDNYLDNMVPDEDATTGAYAAFKGKGKEIFDGFSDVTFPNLAGADTKVFSAEAWAASLGQLEGADFIIPSIDTLYKIFSAMKADGSDPVNETQTRAGATAFSVNNSRWASAKSVASEDWAFYSGGYTRGYGMLSLPRAVAVAEIDL